MVERGGLVDLHRRELQLIGQRHQVGSGEIAVVILYPVQILNQQVATPLTFPQPAVAAAPVFRDRCDGLDYRPSFVCPFSACCQPPYPPQAVGMAANCSNHFSTGTDTTRPPKSHCSGDDLNLNHDDWPPPPISAAFGGHPIQNYELWSLFWNATAKLLFIIVTSQNIRATESIKKRCPHLLSHPIVFPLSQ